MAFRDTRGHPELKTRRKCYQSAPPKYTIFEFRLTLSTMRIAADAELLARESQCQLRQLNAQHTSAGLYSSHRTYLGAAGAP